MLHYVKMASKQRWTDDEKNNNNNWDLSDDIHNPNKTKKGKKC